MAETRNSEQLKSFVDFCEKNPDLRFWQALANWCGWHSVLVSSKSPIILPEFSGLLWRPEEILDTYSWEESREYHG